MGGVWRQAALRGAGPGLAPLSGGGLADQGEVGRGDWPTEHRRPLEAQLAQGPVSGGLRRAEVAWAGRITVDTRRSLRAPLWGAPSSRSVLRSHRCPARAMVGRRAAFQHGHGPGWSRSRDRSRLKRGGDTPACGHPKADPARQRAGQTRAQRHGSLRAGETPAGWRCGERTVIERGPLPAVAARRHEEPGRAMSSRWRPGWLRV